MCSSNRGFMQRKRERNTAPTMVPLRKQGGPGEGERTVDLRVAEPTWLSRASVGSSQRRRTNRFLFLRHSDLVIVVACPFPSHLYLCPPFRRSSGGQVVTGFTATLIRFRILEVGKFGTLVRMYKLSAKQACVSSPPGSLGLTSWSATEFLCMKNLLCVCPGICGPLECRSKFWTALRNASAWLRKIRPGTWEKVKLFLTSWLHIASTERSPRTLPCRLRKAQIVRQWGAPKGGKQTA